MTTDVADHDAEWVRPPTLSTTWLILAIATPTIIGLLSQTPSIDLAYQLRAGDIMLEQHRLLTVDPFTFTVQGEYWLNQQWGAQILLALWYRAFHWAGLAMLRGALIALSSAFVYLACRARGARARTAALLTVAGAVVGAQVLSPLRPQAFAVALFTLCLWAISTRLKHPTRIWFFPPVVLLWVNVHGSFPLAFVLLAFAWLEDRRDHRSTARRTLFATAVSLLVTAANPYGVRVWTYLVTVATHPVVRRFIGEWSPPTIRSWTGRAFLVSVFAVAGLLARREGRVPWVSLVELGTLAALGFAAGRGVVWWALATPVLVSGLVVDRAPTEDAVRSPINAIMAVIALLALAIAVPAQRGTDPITAGPAWLQFAPENLVSVARTAVQPGTRAFVSEPYASWSEFSAPGLPVAIDPRIELFPASVWDDYLSVSMGRQGWQDVLDRWNVGVLILHPGEAEGLLTVIGSDPQWRPLLDAPDGSVYVRT